MRFFRFQGAEINSSLERAESESNIPQLSDEARVLLKEASQDSQGHILYYYDMDGPIIQIGGKPIRL